MKVTQLKAELVSYFRHKIRLSGKRQTFLGEKMADDRKRNRRRQRRREQDVIIAGALFMVSLNSIYTNYGRALFVFSRLPLFRSTKKTN